MKATNFVAEALVLGLQGLDLGVEVFDEVEQLPHRGAGGLVGDAIQIDCERFQAPPSVPGPSGLGDGNPSVPLELNHTSGLVSRKKARRRPSS